MRKIVLLLFGVSLLSGVNAAQNLKMNEDDVNKQFSLPFVDGMNELVTIDSNTPLPAHFSLSPDGKIQMTDLRGADYENPKLRKFTFKVNVENKKSGNKRTEDVVIDIMDVNDEPPVITGPFPASPPYPNGLPQNLTGLFYKGVDTLDGAFIYCVTARDPDTNAKLSYSFTPMDQTFIQTLEANFKIVGVGCIVRKGNNKLLTSPISYRFPVRVTDLNSKHPDKASTDAYVSAFLAFQPPQIAAKPYIIQFTEGTTDGTVIGHIYAVQMHSRYNKMEWTISDKDAGTLGWPFTVDKNNGAVKLTDDTHTKVYNRICRQQWHAKVTVTEIGSLASVKSSETVLIIQLLDKNNLPPFFEHSDNFAKVSETIPPTEQIMQINVIDPDTTSKKDLMYTLEGNDKAYFKVTKSTVGPFYPAMISASGNPKFDFEDPKRPSHLYEFDLAASDGVHPKVLTSVIVEVSNANDEQPIYNKSVDTVYVNRNTHPIVVYQVQAIDPDGSTLKYGFIDPSTKSTTDNEFKIDPDTGIVSYTKAADAAVSKRNLLITAKDQGDCSYCDAKATSPKQTSKHFTLVVHFIDPNAHTPTFNVCPSVITVDENKPAGTVVDTVKLSATDDDKGKNGEITYSLKGNSYTDNPTKYFTINKSTGELKTALLFDREDYAANYWSVWITVEASDSGDDLSTRLSTTCTMHLKIRDLNDESPEFVLPIVNGKTENYLIVMLEKLYIAGSPIMSVFAYDADEFGNKNSKIDYSFDGTPPSFVKIDSTKGDLTFKTDKTLTMAERSIVFTVKATDQGIPKNYATAKVEIFVTDKTDELAPTVEYPKSKDVLETTPDRSNILSIFVEPMPNSDFNFYEITGKTAATNKGMTPLSRSMVNASEYVIQITGAMNAARLNHVYYSAMVMLNKYIPYNSNKKWVYSLIYVLVNIKDVNNKIPHFITFSFNQAYIKVPENAIFTKDKNNPITTLFAADQDLDILFRKVTLYIKQTEETLNFEFVNDQLFINKTNLQDDKFDFEKVKSYRLEVIAKDGAPSSDLRLFPKHNEQTVSLTIEVTDVNDNKPFFRKTKYTATPVPEDTEIGKIVFKLEAGDDDVVSKNNLTYNIENTGSVPFGIHAKDGTIYVARRLDYEVSKSYTLHCMVSDGKYTAQTKVEIDVSDVNDEPIQFNKASYTLPSFEITDPFTPSSIWPNENFNVKDPDGPTSNNIRVTASGKWTANPTNYFGIERVAGNKFKFVVKSGEMKPWLTTETLDRKYRFMLKAEKIISGKATIYSYAHVTVGPVKKPTEEPLCFDRGSLLGWPIVDAEKALTLKAINPDSPSSDNTLQYSVADAKYAIKNKNEVHYKSPPKATGPNTITSFMVTVKEPSPSKELTARAFITVQPKSRQTPTCSDNTVTVYSNTKAKEVFFVLRIQNAEEANPDELELTTLSPNTNLKITLLKHIYSVGFSLTEKPVKIAPVTVQLKHKNSNKPPNKCIVNFVLKAAPGTLTMTVFPTESSISENLSKDLPKRLAEISVEDSASDPKNKIKISMELKGNLITNPGLELVMSGTKKAFLFVTKPLNREALTTGSEDAKIIVKLIAKSDNNILSQTTKEFELTVQDVNETPTITPMTASVLMTNAPQSVTPTFSITDGDKSANRGSTTVEVTGPAAALFSVKTTAGKFTLSTKAGADLSKQSSPIFVPVKITEGSLPSKTVMLKITLTDNQLTDTNREVNAVVSSGWHWYWLPTIAKIPIGNIYGKVLTSDVKSTLTYDIPDNKFWYPSYFELDGKTGELSIIGAVPAGEYKVVGRAKRDSTTAKATVTIKVRVASNQAVQHSATLRINGVDAQHLVLRQKKAGTTGASTSDFSPSILTQIQEIIAKKLQTESKKVVILSAQEFRDSAGAPYIEILYAVSGSPYYTPSKLNYYSKQAIEDIKKIVPAGYPPPDIIDRCATSGTTCPFGCVNRIRVNQEDKDVTVNPTASFVGLKISIQAVCGCEFKPDYPPPDCSINACLNDGKCTLAPGTVNARCECPKGLGLTGPRCQKLDVNFNSRQGYVMTESIGSCSDLHISFEFISTATPTNEVLLYAGPYVDGSTKDYLLVGLEDRKPYLEVLNKEGDTKKTALINSTPISKDKWYRLDIFYKRNGEINDYMEIMINRCLDGVSTTALDGVKVLDRSKCSKRVTLSNSEPSINRRIDVSSYPLQVGGSNLKKYADRGLIGSIRRVRVNSKLRNLLVAKQGLSANADDNKALNATCWNSDGKPTCGEHAVCRPGPSKEQKCKCLPGYHKNSAGLCDVATKIMDFKKNSFTFWKLKADPLPQNSRLRTWTSIRFRTRLTFGTLLYFTSDDGYRNQSVEVRLKNSRVQVVYNLGDYSFTEVTLPNMNVSDGDWHSVEVDRILNEFEITLDNGEYGNYILFRKGGPNDKFNFLTLKNEFLGGLRWKRQYSDLNIIEYFFSDISNTCLTDVRWNDDWVPMLSADENGEEAKATVERDQNRTLNCPNPTHCLNAPKCPAPFTCVPQIWRPLYRPACGCALGSVLSAANGKSVCVALGVCYPNPCPGGTCQLDNTNKRGYKCICRQGYTGDNCEIALVTTASLGGGLIALIVILLLLIIAAILLYLFFVKCRRRDEKLLADPDDYTRENITPYDEEGAGEEDHDHYDLTYLRKPVMGDIRPVKSMPLGAAPHRPSDLGNFLDGRLQDAENDPHGPPQDYSLDYGYEGQGSVVDDLSSLGSGTSDGSQQYDHLHNLGPKFRPLHDLYNHQRNV